MINLQLWKQKKKELSLNYTEIAKMAGVSKRSVEDIFRGYTKSPRIDTVEAIEKALCLSDPVTPEERATGVVDTAKVDLTPKEDELITLVRQKKEKYGEPIENAIIAFVKNL